MESTKKQELDELLDSEKLAAKSKRTQCNSAHLTKKPESESQICEFKVAADRSTIRSHYDTTLARLEILSQEFKTQEARCKNSTDNWKAKHTAADGVIHEHAAVAATCVEDLTALETLSGRWGQKAKDKWSAYSSCYDSAVTEMNELRAKTKSIVESEKEQYKSAKLMECMAGAIDSSGSVGADKVKECKAKTIDTSHMNVTIPKLPPKGTYQKPTRIPDTQFYKELIDILPAGMKDLVNAAGRARTTKRRSSCRSDSAKAAKMKREAAKARAEVQAKWQKMTLEQRQQADKLAKAARIKAAIQAHVKAREAANEAQVKLEKMTPEQRNAARAKAKAKASKASKAAQEAKAKAKASKAKCQKTPEQRQAAQVEAEAEADAAWKVEAMAAYEAAKAKAEAKEAEK